MLCPSQRVIMSFISCVGAVASLASSATAQWVPPYWQFQRIGIYDVPHTGSGGRQTTTATAMNPAGTVVGTSLLYLGTSSPLGQSAWVWTPQTSTVRLGFFDAEHGGGAHTVPNKISPNGATVVGNSRRYTGSIFRGQTAWIWTPTLGNTRLGFLDAEHTGTGGYRFSDSFLANSAGRATGYSTTFSGGVALGVTNWTWTQDEGLTRIGLTDTEHTRADGARGGNSIKVSETGYIVGTSVRYIGSAEAGNSAWIWSPDGVQTRLGPVDAEHTRADGTKDSLVTTVNDAGRVAGQSRRYLGQASLGFTAWTWTADSGQTNIGLVDVEHTRSDGFRSSGSRSMNEAGQILGTSSRHTPGGGQSAWRWTSGLTQRIGLFDAEHTLSTGAQTSTPLAMNSKGETIGTSVRTTGSGGTVYNSAWFADAAGQTHRLGLLEGVHTGSNGRQNSSPQFITESAVVGSSTRYTIPGFDGISSWYYDIATQVTTPLIFSISAEGQSRTGISALTESGWVVGIYDDYEHEPLGADRGFLWSLEHGLTDLGSLLEGGLAPSGWGTLAGTLGAAEFQAIVGNMELNGGLVDASYVLTIPAPASIGVLSLIAIAVRRRR